MSALDEKGSELVRTLDERIAQELADILMRHALTGGPLSRIAELSRVLRILRMTARIVTERRDREAYALGAWGSHRKLARLAGVSPSTMQRWAEAGQRATAGQSPVVVGPQEVSRETGISSA